MNIGILGYGKMGKMVERIALERGHQITSIISRSGKQNEINEENAKDVDVFIDFTLPDAVLDNARKLISLEKHFVIGTTGWFDKLDLLSALIKNSKVGCLYAPNFSIGMNIFLSIVNNAAAIIDKFDQYDIAGTESHHNQKVDSPSGAAKLITDSLLEKIQRKKSVVYDLGNRKIEDHELHFSSIRCGSVPGTHQVIFDSPSDTITLSHQARNREGFAHGAITAAEWIKEKKGLYNIKDMINI